MASNGEEKRARVSGGGEVVEDSYEEYGDGETDGDGQGRSIISLFLCGVLVAFFGPIVVVGDALLWVGIDKDSLVESGSIEVHNGSIEVI
ncbi:hypothetical protein SUGI_0007700 [Cryptomeria japonica]|nr:hypothetical protein SUGI_0007700 [Cryptomeria japonica]